MSAGADHEEPSQAHRSTAEVAHVDVERLAAREDQEHRAENRQRDAGVSEQYVQRVPRIERHQNLWRGEDLAQAEQSDREKPYQHDWPEQAADALGASALQQEQRNDNRKRGRDDELLHMRIDDLEAFDGTENGDRGRDQRFAVKERGPEDSEQKQARHRLAASFKLLLHQRDERKNAAFTIVVGTQDKDDVLERDDEEQAPEDHR